ncbi:MAG: DUF1566 domain-containing protein [Bacteroidetes bacterium]|nr:DUF1566 domain-containing protein [Bacteroidota bacterium]
MYYCTTTGIAARICGNLLLNGYTGWFLPSLNELNEMYIHRTMIGGFASSYYWSSTENAASDAWIMSFSENGQTNIPKNNTCHVRAIRAF